MNLVLNARSLTLAIGLSWLGAPVGCLLERGWDYHAPGLVTVWDRVGEPAYRASVPGRPALFVATQVHVSKATLYVVLLVHNRGPDALRIDERRIGIVDAIGTRFVESGANAPCWVEVLESAGVTLVNDSWPVAIVPAAGERTITCEFPSPPYPSPVVVRVDGFRVGGKAIAPVIVRLEPD